MANLVANDEISQRENEQTQLLAFSNNIATVRDREGLSTVISEGLKRLFNIELYILSIINDDELTHSYYIIDTGSKYDNSADFDKIRDKKFDLKGALGELVLNSRGPVVFNVDNIIKEGKITFSTAGFWQSMGVDKILGVPLRIGRKNFGILWAHSGEVNNSLMEGVASQIGIAIAHYIAAQKVEKQLNEISDFKQRLEIENRYLQEEIHTTYNYSEIVGSSPAMKNIFHLVTQVAQSNSSVLILGETGTGKELIARALHNDSPRKNKLMVKVNCATLPANLIESELFGHEKGSFTGAIERRIGKFELANNSTLFLDEIGELPLDLQVKLLRAIQEKEIERIGGRTVIKTNVRIIAATNRDLAKEVTKGNFRSDLYFRLNVFPIQLPPLRERKEDITSLTMHFLHKYGGNGTRGPMSLSAKAYKQLESYSWPGNVRELEHLIERSILISKGPVINEIYLPNYNSPENNTILPDDYVKTIDEVEREHIIAVLKRCNGKVSGIGGAAELLRIPSTTLNSKMIRLKIHKGLSSR
ncbi:AAA family ATPase [Mucilaginibacter conchicola]|uniref:AAA family ATPase n=1 Tax=Mucilaginibacter conchicola TaxID=2303333 RepID=A0A372NRB6_9SPHI|nr:AAA family ATPase [Mucilaginibacter conchicola]